MHVLKSSFSFLTCLSLSLLSQSSFSRTNTSAKANMAVPSYKDIWKKSAGPYSGDIFLLPKKGNFFLEEKDFKQENLLHSSYKGKQLPPHPITMHGFARDYDLEIPIVFYDESKKWITPGSYPQYATQQDITPTLASILDVPPPAKRSGRVLEEILTHKDKSKIPPQKPKAILVFVQDQMGKQYLRAHPGTAKFYEEIMKNGANFAQSRVSHVDVETSVGHTAVGTGAWPSEHGVSGNDFFHSGLWKQVKAFSIPTTEKKNENLFGNPSFLFTPTLGDVWLTSTAGKAVVFSQVYALRAAIGMAGHGAMFGDGFKSAAVWTDENNDSADQYITNEQLYNLPKSHRGNSVKPYAEKLVAKTNGSWRGHPLFRSDGSLDASAVKASPAATEWEGDLAIAAIKELGIGKDDVTDLVYINTKGTDACGHRYGYESDECKEILAMTDAVSQKIYNEIKAATNGEFLAVLTADHGAAALPEISGSTRYSRQRLIKDLNKKFDRRDNQIDSIQLVTSSQVYLNHAELAANGHKTSEVVQFLKQYKVPFEAPFNVLASEWIKKGNAKVVPFFDDVASREEL